VTNESRELVQRASQGDVVAVDELLERHLPGLRKYVRQRISPALLAKESSSDVVQSVCREVLEGFEGFEYQGEGAFRNWLYQTAVRKLVDHLRYHQAQKRDVQHVAPPSLTSAEFAVLASSIRSPSGDAMLGEQIKALERGFARLGSAEQEILRLVYVEGLSHAQVSSRLGCTEVSSRKQLSRALARLAGLLG
jgi:RNA polymerase sigma-70 factor (ECF subfamily)